VTKERSDEREREAATDGRGERRRWLESQTLSDVAHLRSEFWDRARQVAERLPAGARRGQYVKLAAELGNPHRAARELGLSKKAGEWAWRRFLVFAGLPAPLVKGSQGRKRPNRPGLVRIEAGRFREEAA
jgi:hypothetical protein